MSGVYSGGIAYEYSLEPNGYGIVEIDGDDVEELQDYEDLRKAFNDVELPQGDGGGRTEDGEPSECPAQSDVWDVEDETLPAIPEAALAMFDEGADEGFGLVTGDPGSQNAGEPSEGFAENDEDAAADFEDDDEEGGDDDDEEGSESAAVSVRPVMAVGAFAAVAAIGAGLF